jgi:cytochrome c biogenesis protein CcmG, thiol:disulfide interchange protein DsbE
MVTEFAVPARISMVMCTVSLLAAGACVGTPQEPAGSRPATTKTSVATSCPAQSGKPVRAIPPMVLPCLTRTARSVQLAVSHGKPQVINVWASWCGPCRDEMPLLQAAHEAVGRRVLFLGVAVRDSRSRALAFLSAHGVTYPQVLDERGQFPEAMRFAGVPDTLVIAADGKVVDEIIGVLARKRLARDLTHLAGSHH